jgi:demethylmenaquinone methyltransferase/2-methoxy-6-polyprenyl-1,4-benzoquinol methylase
VKAYYEARAPEYDDWWTGAGRFVELDRPGFDEERDSVVALLRRLTPARTLDVGCGTGYLSRNLPGEIIGVDQSPTSLRIAAARLPGAELVQADVPPLPLPAGGFERVFTSQFYGHLEEAARSSFLAEARRVASELVVLDASLAHSPVDVESQPRVLNDGTRWEVYKRFFTPESLLAELGPGETLHTGHWFVAVRS